MKLILSNCTVIDCTGAEPRSGVTVELADGMITSVAMAETASEPVDSTARVVDLAGAFVLPGLWSVHTHLGYIAADTHNTMLTESVADYTIRSGRNAMDALRSGFTGVRTMGDRDFVDVAWKRAFNSGMMLGPRLFVCGHYICATGGHAHNWPGAVQIDGPVDMRRVVREQLKHGVDHIKIAVTGGVATAGESMQESQLLRDEIEAATEIAHQKGRKVAVHAGGPGGIKMAILGGVDCIEHGYFTDDESIELMCQHDVFFVPTLFITQNKAFMRRIGMADFQVAKAEGAAEAHREGFRKALAAGVKIACGSDASPIGEQGLAEIEELVRAGMTPMQALIAATRTGADLCGVAEQFGTVEPGKRADLIVLAANPLEDISNIRSLTMVIKDGHVVDITPHEGIGDFLDIVWGR